MNKSNVKQGLFMFILISAIIGAFISYITLLILF
jgi:hypothetical protein